MYTNICNTESVDMDFVTYQSRKNNTEEINHYRICPKKRKRKIHYFMFLVEILLWSHADNQNMTITLMMQAQENLQY